MKSMLQVSPELALVNGVSGDPAVLFSLPTEGSTVLFDMGQLDNLSIKQILRCELVLVSHTHIDHFVGFDRLLRLTIPHRRQRTLVGPPNFAQRIAAKLRAYTWNLLESEQLVFVVREIDRAGAVSEWRITNDNQFTPVPTDGLPKPATQSRTALVAQLSQNLSVEASALDHGIESIAYKLVNHARWQVKIDAIRQDGLQPGSWIRALQTAIQGQHFSAVIDTGAKQETAAALMRYLQPSPKKSLGYVTDIAFSRDNLERCRELFSEATHLVIETCFMDRDRARAAAKRHLTTKQAALIGAIARAEKLTNFHVSSIYGEASEAVCQEVQDLFENFRSLGTSDLELAVEHELAASNPTG